MSQVWAYGNPYHPIPAFRELILMGESDKVLIISAGILVVVCLTIDEEVVNSA